MLGNQITLFKLLGFDIKIDLSWLFLVLLVTWTLADGFFPSRYEGYDPVIYWRMGIFGALGLFVSIVIHELAHSVVARRYGIPIKAITLFIFGGVAEMGGEPPSAKAEFRMAIAGPIASAVLAFIFYWVHEIAVYADFGEPVLGVFYYLSAINALLAIFNLIPAYPLDGGRVLRSFLWARKNDLRWATDLSSRIGSGFGVCLIIIGFLSVIRGDFIGGIWWFLIGMFLRQAAKASHIQVLVKDTFGGQPVSRFMTPDPETVSSLISVETLIEDHIYRTHHQGYPVVEDGRLVGYIGTREVREVPLEKRSHIRVGHIMKPLTNDAIVAPDFEAMEALSLMNRTSNSRLLVVESGRLIGIVTLKDMLGFLSAHLDLERPGR